MLFSSWDIRRGYCLQKELIGRGYFSLDLELLRKLLGGIAHYFLHKTLRCQTINKIVCYLGKNAMLEWWNKRYLYRRTHAGWKQELFKYRQIFPQWNTYQLVFKHLPKTWLKQAKLIHILAFMVSHPSIFLIFPLPPFFICQQNNQLSYFRWKFSFKTLDENIFPEGKMSPRIIEVHSHAEGSTSKAWCQPSQVLWKLRSWTDIMHEDNFPPNEAAIISLLLSPLFMKFSWPVQLSNTGTTSNSLQVSNLKADGIWRASSPFSCGLMH